MHALFDFTSRLLQGTYPTNQQANVLVSPLSALFALALAETGATSDTLSQLETATGMDIDSLATYLGAYARRISGEDLYDVKATFTRRHSRHRLTPQPPTISIPGSVPRLMA